MKHSNVRVITALTVVAATLAGCGGLGKMAKYAETITHNLDPNPLIVRGDSVAVNINGNFPGKYFNKKASADLTPVLVYTGGETPYKTVTFQGEDAVGNGTVIPYENGRDYSYTSKIAYQPNMKSSDLMLRITGRQGKKEKDFEPYKLADGVITTPYLMLSDDQVLIAKDNFERITKHTHASEIKYLVNSSAVRPTELNREGIKQLDNLLKDQGQNDAYSFKKVTITSYASPEGEISLNENLASDRANTAKNAVDGIAKRRKLKGYDAAAMYELKPMGEDWNGFKKAMEKSDITDKDLILRILEMYNDVTKREQEIRNLAATYVEVAERILPDLRRSEINTQYEIVGKTDDEIAALSKEGTTTDAEGKRVHKLNVEELLYAATLTNDVNEQFAIYTKAGEAYPQDHRAFNNLGVIEMMRNDLTKAEQQFTKANQLQNNPVSNNNLGVIQRLQGNRKGALEKFNASMAAGNEVKYNKALVQIQNGDWSEAITNMSGFSTYNKALVQVLNGDAQGAASTLSNAPEKDTAEGKYLSAIIGARLNNGDQVKNSLQAAYQLDGSLKERAAEDLEFRNFQNEIK